MPILRWNWGVEGCIPIYCVDDCVGSYACMHALQYSIMIRTVCPGWSRIGIVYRSGLCITIVPKIVWRLCSIVVGLKGCLLRRTLNYGVHGYPAIYPRDISQCISTKGHGHLFSSAEYLQSNVRWILTGYILRIDRFACSAIALGSMACFRTY